MLLAYRLVRLIEDRSDELASGLVQKLQRDPNTREYLQVPPEDFRTAVYGIYHNLGEWLMGKTEADIKNRYVAIGAKRAQQGVSLSELIYAINLTKDNLLEFLKDKAVAERPAEAFGELEVLFLLGQFFDRATYYAAVGYEQAREARAAVYA